MSLSPEKRLHVEPICRIWIRRKALPLFRTLFLLLKLRVWVCGPWGLPKLCFSSVAHLRSEFLLWRLSRGDYGTFSKCALWIYRVLGGASWVVRMAIFIRKKCILRQFWGGNPHWVVLCTLSRPCGTYVDRWLPSPLLCVSVNWVASWDCKVSCWKPFPVPATYVCLSESFRICCQDKVQKLMEYRNKTIPVFPAPWFWMFEFIILLSLLFLRLSL